MRAWRASRARPPTPAVAVADTRAGSGARRARVPPRPRSPERIHEEGVARVGARPPTPAPPERINDECLARGARAFSHARSRRSGYTRRAWRAPRARVLPSLRSPERMHEYGLARIARASSHALRFRAFGRTRRGNLDGVSGIGDPALVESVQPPSGVVAPGGPRRVRGATPEGGGSVGFPDFDLTHGYPT